MSIKTISIIGSGWLGLPLAEYFVSTGHPVKASTTSCNRLPQLSSQKIEPFILDIGLLPDNLHSFLQANVLIVNIPSKNIDGFASLIKEIEKSTIERVLFVSSTSVYKDSNKTLFESDDAESTMGPLFSIENMFSHNNNFTTTIVRFGGLIGYSRNPANFFKPGRTVANPDSAINMIHRDDCINIISQIVEQQVWGEVFNCCADTHPTKRDFYTQATRNTGTTTPVFIESDKQSFKIISNQKVKRMLNYTFLHADLMQIKFP